jgi:hypothetical protein
MAEKEQEHEAGMKISLSSPEFDFECKAARAVKHRILGTEDPNHNKPRPKRRRERVLFFTRVINSLSIITG